MNNFMKNMFGQVAPGMVRLSMDGKLAIKTSNGYKTYDVATGVFTNCDDFVFNIAEDFFFLIPTVKAAIGDIILVGDKPCCVIKVEDNMISALCYEDGSIKNFVPEKRMFFGNTCIYGKIVSMFGGFDGGTNMDQMMKYMMMSEMMKGKGDNNSMLPMLMMMNGNFTNMFGDFFNTTNAGGEQ